MCPRPPPPPKKKRPTSPVGHYLGRRGWELSGANTKSLANPTLLNQAFSLGFFLASSY